MATFVASHTGTDSSPSVTLDGSGTNRAIVIVSSAEIGHPSTVATGLTVGGTAATLLVTQGVGGNDKNCVAIGLVLDANHPGAGAATFSHTFSAGITANTFVVFEFSDWIAQDSAEASVVLNSIPGLVSGTTYTATATGEAGNTAINFLTATSASAYASDPVWTFSSGLNRVTDFPNSQKNTCIAAYTTSIASADENFSITYTGSQDPGAFQGVVVLSEAAPAVTTTDTLQPGTEFTLTATNYASAPVSPATLTDSEGSTITVPVTISGSGPYTAVGTMPTLAEAVTAGTSLLFGDVTIELST